MRKKKSNLPTKFPYYYMCWACAEAKGGVWPKGHCATAHQGTCEYCGTKGTTLIPYVDFNWPKDPDTDKVAKRNRD